MLETNPNFDAPNLKLVKRPLYVLLIDGMLDALTTFRPEDVQVVWGGYGVGGYGTTGYGN
ncbi:MAG: hypothetical protein LAO07_21485 [Acidobacteriia bacterium]|nr:hypothetical protein [Terriglobia bacterium]